MPDLAALRDGLASGRLMPFLGGGVLELDGEPSIPSDTHRLATELTKRIAVPGRIRHRLWASAYYIEAHRHRVTLVRTLGAIFSAPPTPNRLHRALAGWPRLPLIVDLWFDAAMATALAEARADAWGQTQGVSRSEHRDRWWLNYGADGTLIEDAAAAQWPLLLYKPWGGIAPAANFIISDSDLVEVMAEIDIQSPIPATIRERRRDGGFLFLGLRFDNQTARQFAAQIIKRSAGPHMAVIEGALSRNEARFLERLGIRRIDRRLAEVVESLTP